MRAGIGAFKRGAFEAVPEGDLIVPRLTVLRLDRIALHDGGLEQCGRSFGGGTSPMVAARSSTSSPQVGQ